MTERFSFLNWRPDLNDVGHDGLAEADNCIHEPDGYRPTHLGTAGAFATTGGLAASNNTVISVVAKPVGSQGDLFCAWVIEDGAFTNAVHVGINGVTASTSATGFPLTALGATGGAWAITALDVAEYEERIHFVVRAQNATLTPVSFHGWMDF